MLRSARNDVRYGVFASRGAGILNSGFVERGNWVIYSHHPPLTAWASAAGLVHLEMVIEPKGGAGRVGINPMYYGRKTRF